MLSLVCLFLLVGGLAADWHERRQWTGSYRPSRRQLRQWRRERLRLR